MWGKLGAGVCCCQNLEDVEDETKMPREDEKEDEDKEEEEEEERNCITRRRSLVLAVSENITEKGRWEDYNSHRQRTLAARLCVLYDREPESRKSDSMAA